ncbi:MAG: hypothetical protein AB1797_09960 [bacterium]
MGKRETDCLARVAEKKGKKNLEKPGYYWSGLYLAIAGRGFLSGWEVL